MSEVGEGRWGNGTGTSMEGLLGIGGIEGIEGGMQGLWSFGDVYAFPSYALPSCEVIPSHPIASHHIIINKVLVGIRKMSRPMKRCVWKRYLIRTHEESVDRLDLSSIET